MLYRLRILDSNGRLLVETVHDSLADAGRQMARFPLDEFMERSPDGSGSASVRYEVVCRDASGGERPATEEETRVFLEAMARHQREMAAEAIGPCPRCHCLPTAPYVPTRDGPLCFDCLTPEERQRLPPPFRDSPR